MKNVYTSPEKSKNAQPGKNPGSSASAPGSLTIKRNKNLDIAAKIGCVLVAFVIWVYVMANDSPSSERVFDQVAVEFTDHSEYDVLSGATEVSVTLKGRRSVINKISDDAIKAFANIPETAKPGWQKVSVDISAPSGTTASAVSPASVMLYLGNRTTVSVPVEIKLTEYTLPEDYELGMSNANPSEVTVTGPEDVLSKIKSARAVIALGNVSSSVTSKAPLTLVDAAGEVITSSFVKLQATEATVSIPVYKYINLPLTLSYKYGFYNPNNVLITVSPDIVRVRGEAALAADAKWTYTIDEKLITGDGMYKIPITLTNGVSNTSDATEATLTVKHVGTTTKQITLTDIAVINPDNLNYTLGDSRLIVTLRGPSSSLSYLTAKNVTATIDLSSFKNSTGSVIVPIAISVPIGMAGSVYELGGYNMTVKLG